MTRPSHQSTRAKARRGTWSAVALLTAACGAAAQSVPAGQGRIWNSTFAREFDAGASDLSGFTYDVGGGGWGNSELQVYTAPVGAPPATPNPSGLGSQTTTPVGINSNNVFVSGGNLNISAIATGSGGGQSYTSGRLKTTNLFSQAYGLFEFRARLPAGQGLWPAVWMMSKDEAYGGWPTSGEIDLLESKGQETGLVQGTLHSGASWASHVVQTRTFQQSGLRPPGFSTTDWHTYSLQWNAGSPNVPATFKWYVDGVNYYTQQGGWHIPAGVPSTNDDAPFDKAFYFLLNVAVGGNYVGAPNLAAGTYTMQIDFLRAYAIALRPTWKLDSSGTWGDTSKWTDSIVPNTADADVLFGSAISQARTVTVDSPRTLGRLTFDAAAAYTLAGAATLTLNTTGADAQINVLNGSHTIAAPVVLNRSTVATVNSIRSLTLSGPLSGSTGITLTKTGAGTLAARHVRGGKLKVSEGTLRILAGSGDAGVSKLEELSIESGATADLADSALMIDYQGASPIGPLRMLIATGSAGGAWNGTGLTSSAAQAVASGAAVHKTALGLGEASDLGINQYAGLSLDSTSVVVLYTYFGDANLDGQVDITDLGSLATSWQSPSVWTSGDFNYDGFTDITDLGLLATNWQAGVVSPLTASDQIMATLGLPTAIPEPGGAAAALLASASLRRRRH